MCGTHACTCPRNLVELASSEGPVVFGPASVEVVSEDDKLIEIDALEEALPQLLRRRALTALHKDAFIIGEIRESIKLDPAKAPTDRARLLLEHLKGEIRTGAQVVTHALADAFPEELTPKIGKKAFFCAAQLYQDSESSRIATREVHQGVLDSFSISGFLTQTQTEGHCDALRGCRPITRAKSLDLSAITLASRTGVHKGSMFGAKARNPGAALLVLQQTAHNHGGQSVLDPPSPGYGEKGPTAEVNQQEPVQMAGEQDPKAIVKDPKATEQAQAAAAGSGDAQARLEQLVIDLARRIEALEQTVATQKAAKATEQATPSAQGSAETVKLVQQAIEAGNKPLHDAVTQLGKRFEPIEQAFAGTKASTPKPAAGARLPAKNLKEVVEAANSGDAATLRAAVNGLHKEVA